MENILEWLQNWYLDHCDGYWEHDNMIKIDTLDNPGWTVAIDLSDTDLEDLEIPYVLKEVSDDNWIGYSVGEKQFKGVSDPKRLTEILVIFKQMWESNVKK